MVHPEFLVCPALLQQLKSRKDSKCDDLMCMRNPTSVVALQLLEQRRAHQEFRMLPLLLL